MWPSLDLGGRTTFASKGSPLEKKKGVRSAEKLKEGSAGRERKTDFAYLTNLRRAVEGGGEGFKRGKGEGR